MKKIWVFLILFFVSFFLWAQDDTQDDTVDYNDGKNFTELHGEESPRVPVKEKFRFKNRMLELSVANVSVDVSNNFVATADILQNPFYMLGNIKDIKQDPSLIYKDPVVINLDDFFSGFTFNFRTAIKPLSLGFNWRDNWGVGLDIGHTDVWGNITVPDKVLSFKQATNEPFGAGGAAFADAGIPFFFHINRFKIKFRPAVYAPIIYAKPGMTYTHKSNDEGTYIEVVYTMRVYSAVKTERDEDENLLDTSLQYLQDNYWDILRNNLGYDLGLNIEYPWNSQFDLGVNFINIPVVMAKLYHYTQFAGTVVLDTSYLDMDDMMNGEISYGNNANGQKIYRPFTTLFYGKYRPRDSHILSLIPSLGFSINPLFPKLPSIEGGLSGRIDIANIFITTLGINYNNRIWKNSIDFILNLRAFELDFGLSSQSSGFIKSWQGAGIGVNFGMRFGW